MHHPNQVNTLTQYEDDLTDIHQETAVTERSESKCGLTHLGCSHNYTDV